MTEDKKDLEIATFRFGIISEFVTGVRLTYGEKEKLIKDKVGRSYNIPYSNRRTISKSSIISWVNNYKKAGYQLLGLFPINRKDKGKYKKLDPTLRLAIKDLKNENSRYTVPTIIRKLRHNKIIKMDETVNHSSVYRYLKNERINSVNKEAADRRRFEAEFPNGIWQSDVMHGPQARINGINKKVYLIAIMDDHSRLITHAEFYPAESLENLKNCLKKAVQKRGLPQKFYVDNGGCFRAINLDQITALLGVSLLHARPFTPQGKGKIERWFRNVRDNFLSIYTEVKSLIELNEMLDSWIEDYHNTVHSTTKITPYQRFRKNLTCVRPAPHNISDYFRVIDFRLVKKDRSFQLKGALFEAPVTLIDKKVELRYHKDNPTQVEIFFNSISYGEAQILSPHINSKLGRDWSTNKAGKTSKLSGKLFKGGNDE